MKFVQLVRRLLAENRPRFGNIIKPEEAGMMTKDAETEKVDPVKARNAAQKKKFSGVLGNNKELDIPKPVLQAQPKPEPAKQRRGILSTLFRRTG